VACIAALAPLFAAGQALLHAESAPAATTAAEALEAEAGRPQGIFPKPEAFPQLPREDSIAQPIDQVQYAGTQAAPGGQTSEPAAVAPPAAAPAAVAAARPKPKGPIQPWKGVFYENDFSFKNDPNHKWLLGEDFKDLVLDDLPPWEWAAEETRFSYGGELRYRLMDEVNRLRPGDRIRANYDLWRWRQYVDLKGTGAYRVYADMIDASMFRNPLPATGIDINRWDLQNAFVDLNLFELEEGPLWFRVGRQELIYGSQRLISPLDWANTRRNFDGLKVFHRGSAWDLDFWWVRPVNTGTPGDGPVARFDNSFDSPNMNHFLMSAWATSKGSENSTRDFYWIWDRNHQRLGARFPGGNRHTLGTRWLVNRPVRCDDVVERIWHAEVEGGYQFGDDFGKNVNAGFVTGGVGHTWTELPWEPNLWIFYDWASGSRDLQGGTSQTFNQLYGLVHAFLGQIDNIARQNISDINGRLTFKPHRKLTVQGQFHWFDLANENDVLYTISGAPFGEPRRGRHVGEELDLVGTFTLNPNLNVQIGYFWFWYGAFVQNNSPRDKAEQFYLMTTLNY
jgi:hypothetical protein